MRKILVLEFISLDGVIQAPGGPKEDEEGNFKFGGWMVPYADEEVGLEMNEEMKQPFELLLGRKTFEIFAGYWPEHQDAWPGINEARKYAVSNKLITHNWKNTKFINGDVPEEIKKLKREKGPDLSVYGSANLVQTLMRHDLVDEFWLKIFPITLGGGKRLFADGTIPRSFALTESKITPAGVIIAKYRRTGHVKSASF